MSNNLEAKEVNKEMEDKLISAQALLTKLRFKNDCHRIMAQVEYAIKGLYTPEFLLSVMRIQLVLMSNAENVKGTLKKINDYPENTFRIYSQGIKNSFETHEYFGHSVLAWWCAPTNTWYVIDALLMPIAEIGFGAPLVNYLYLIVHHNKPEPIVVVPVVIGLKRICLDGIRMTDNNVDNMVDGQTGALFPEVADAYKGNFMVHKF